MFTAICSCIANWQYRKLVTSIYCEQMFFFQPILPQQFLQHQQSAPSVLRSITSPTVAQKSHQYCCYNSSVNTVYLSFLFHSVDLKKVSEYDQEIPQSQTADNLMAPRGKSRSTIMRHQEDKLSKATSSLFPIKMIALLEWT